MVHRAELQQAAGDWRDAIMTAESACRLLTEPLHPALGLAYYQEAELHRLVGAFDRAAAGYTQAHRHGHHPMPGLALLELARGDPAAAAASVRRTLRETAGTRARAGLLAAAVDVLREAGDPAGARAAADELAQLATTAPAPALRAMADRAIGAVALDDGDPSVALAHLRDAAAAWRKLHMPYEGARTAVLLGLACEALGDRASATLELDTARLTFTGLGARPDLDRLAALSPRIESTAGAHDRSRDGSSLSAREREVLTHVAAGETNRQIASELVISTHTVSRHLQNIFTKLGVTSRAAATAYAYEHDLL
jgi:ATP/maltotriose-dependent transcriptional regulator MalT